MARTELDRSVTPSLLDRLTDLDLGDPADRPLSREESVRRYRQTVQRDIELLLNTRRTIVPVGPQYPEVLASVHEFGLPDTTAITPATPEGRQRLTQHVADTIRRFEPRLSNVVVRLAESDRVKTPQVRFVIEATLRMDPSPEHVVFDSSLDVTNGDIHVQDAP
jgi:type VI secretion system protein ImpF